MQSTVSPTRSKIAPPTIDCQEHVAYVLSPHFPASHYTRTQRAVRAVRRLRVVSIHI